MSHGKQSSPLQVVADAGQQQEKGRYQNHAQNLRSISAHISSQLLVAAYRSGHDICNTFGSRHRGHFIACIVAGSRLNHSITNRKSQINNH
jgi:hypothetical protein